MLSLLSLAPAFAITIVSSYADEANNSPANAPITTSMATAPTNRLGENMIGAYDKDTGEELISPRSSTVPRGAEA